MNTALRIRKRFFARWKASQKKLGGQHFKAAKEKLFEGDMAATIEILLNYYDKAYATGLSKKQDRIIQRPAWNGNNPEQFAATLLSVSHAWLS